MTSLSPESAAVLRAQKRRTLNAALEMAAQLSSSALPLQRPTTPRATGSTGPAPAPDDGVGLDGLQALKRQRDGRQAKRRTLRDGLHALEAAAAGAGKADGENSSPPAPPVTSGLSLTPQPEQPALVKRRSLLPQFWSSAVHPVEAATAGASEGGGAVLVSGDSLVMGGTPRKAGDRLTAAPGAGAAGLSPFRETRLSRGRRSVETAQPDS